MKKSYRYRRRHSNARRVAASVESWKEIAPAQPRVQTFKIRHKITGHFWTGRADHSKFYNHDGETFGSYDEAKSAIQKLLTNGTSAESSHQRIRIRLKEIRNWEIVETKVSIRLTGNRESFDTTEYEVLNQITKINSTLGSVFQRHMDNGRSESIECVIHLNDYTTSMSDRLGALNLSQDVMIMDRTALSFTDLKVGIMVKLALPSVKEIVDVKKIRDGIRSL